MSWYHACCNWKVSKIWILCRGQIFYITTIRSASDLMEKIRHLQKDSQTRFAKIDYMSKWLLCMCCNKTWPFCPLTNWPTQFCPKSQLRSTSLTQMPPHPHNFPCIHGLMSCFTHSIAIPHAFYALTWLLTLQWELLNPSCWLSLSLSLAEGQTKSALHKYLLNK